MCRKQRPPFLGLALKQPISPVSLLTPAEDLKATLGDSRGPEGRQLDPRSDAWRRALQKPPSEPHSLCLSKKETLLFSATEVWGCICYSTRGPPISNTDQ